MSSSKLRKTGSISFTFSSDKETKKYTEYSYKDAPRSESHQIVTVGIQHSETLSSFYFKLGAAVFKEDFAPLKRKIYRLAKDNEYLIINKTITNIFYVLVIRCTFFL